MRPLSKRAHDDLPPKYLVANGQGSESHAPLCIIGRVGTGQNSATQEWFKIGLLHGLDVEINLGPIYPFSD